VGSDIPHDWKVKTQPRVGGAFFAPSGCDPSRKFLTAGVPL